MAHTLRVAVTQVEPEWFDLKGTVKKTCDLIAEAAANGARLIAFPECWVPGYPGWIWARPLDVELNTKYIYNSLSLGSPEFENIQAAAKSNSIAVVLGFAERAPSGSLYIAQAIISPAGEVLMHRRKLKPTHAERTVFGDGGGGDLSNVVDVDFGGAIGSVRVGALACWEHTQPLLKYHTLSLRETVHIAMWPPLDPHGGVEHPGAIESGAFVLQMGYFSTLRAVATAAFLALTADA